MTNMQHLPTSRLIAMANVLSLEIDLYAIDSGQTLEQDRCDKLFALLLRELENRSVVVSDEVIMPNYQVDTTMARDSVPSVPAASAEGAGAPSPKTETIPLDGEAIERLARHLHFTMERFDPSEDGNWSRMTNADQEFYRSCVRELLWELTTEPKLIQALLPD